MLLAGLLVALALLLACAHTSYLVATRLLPEAPTSARLSAAAIIAYVLLVAVFFLLSPVRGFRPAPALASWAGVAAVAHLALGRGGAWRRALARDLAAARDAWAAAGWARWLLLATFPVGVRVARGLVSPPLGWDSLTYHLAKAGMWVQAGGFTALPGPDANRSYDQLPAHGDVLWAWAMLPVHGDALLALAGAAVWMVALLATYACAREVGAAPRGALLGALAVVLSPAAASYVTTSYVDNVVLAAFAAAALFLLRASSHGGAGDGAAAGLALGALVGTKSTGLLVMAVGFALLALAVVRGRARFRWLLLALGAGACGAVPYLRSWIETGNPLYPFPVSVAGHAIFPGSPSVVEIWAEHARSTPPFSLFFFVARLATPIPLVPEADRMGFGPGLLLVLPLGLLGAVGLYRAGRAQTVAILLALSGALIVPQLGAPWLWIVHVASVQRYVLGVFAALAVLAAAPQSPRIHAALAAAAACGAVLALPRGIGPAERHALVQALPGLCLLGLVSVVTVVLWRRGRPRVAAVLAVVAAAVALVLVHPARANRRKDIYRDAGRSLSFDPHFLHAEVGRAWPIWNGLDAGPPRRIALTAGYDAFHNWFWYPFLGSALQNHVSYVPITADGGVVDYRDAAEVTRRASFTHWLRRLLDARIDDVVLLAPSPPEAQWVASAPRVFEPGLAGIGETSRAYRFRAEEARKVLGGTDRSGANGGE